MTSDAGMDPAMDPMIDSGIDSAMGPALDRATTRGWERGLLFAAAAILPFEIALPTVGGRTLPFYLYATLGLLALVLRRDAFLRTARTPLLALLLASAAAALVMELAHGGWGLVEAARWMITALAAVAIASLCRDHAALRAALLGYLGSGAVLSLAQIIQIWPRIYEASHFRIRFTAFDDFVFKHDINTLSFFAAQAGIVAIAFLLASRSTGRRWAWALVAALCVVGTLLPMSRGGTLALLVGAAAVLVASPHRSLRLLFPLALPVVLALLVLPEVTFERFRAAVGSHTRSERVRLLSATWEHLPEYIWHGVGVERFHGEWGTRSLFLHPRDSATQTTHTTFSQLAVYWGLPVLIPALLLVGRGRRTLPARNREDPLTWALAGLSLALLVRAMVASTFHSRIFAVGLGILAASRTWVWPAGLRDDSVPGTASAREPDDSWLFERARSARRAAPAMLAIVLVVAGALVCAGWKVGRPEAPVEAGGLDPRQTATLGTTAPGARPEARLGRFVHSIQPGPALASTAILALYAGFLRPLRRRRDDASPTSPKAQTSHGRRAPRVLQVVGSLSRAGEERMAVEIANALSREGFASHLCATRRGGPLRAELSPDVRIFELRRRGRYDPLAPLRLRRFCRTHAIDLVHAHGASLFLAAIALVGSPIRLVWHDHWGQDATRARPVRAYRWATRRCAGVITVSQDLAAWSRDVLSVEASKVWVLPNFLPKGSAPADEVDLDTSRLVCVAHFRPHKDHLSLVRAFARVRPEAPEAQLILVGDAQDAACYDAVQHEIRSLGCGDHISVLGLRHDVEEILREGSIGVVSSISEGFPVTLLEYGQAGLACLSTEVGECREILDGGRAGLLVPPGSVDALADGMTRLLLDTELRRELSSRLQGRVSRLYTADRVVHALADIYETLLEKPAHEVGETAHEG